ncbi:hypothetical protein B0O99DRAFT_588389 [Bisporella sp. PMI_857]|nr:hypothetical protein B0O99DRAFT_588389 [Bisporella sp. PMI_857]
MSRTLDAETLSLIKVQNAQEVYHDIVKAITSNPSKVLEYEFLGKAHPLPPNCNVLVDGNSIGIPKARLVQAFVVARRLFISYLGDLKAAPIQDVRNVTAILLLMDPENITAANARKGLIQGHQKGFGTQLVASLKQELIWVDGLLTSHLHRHTKSPTLWGHRRWLLETCSSMKLPYDVYADLEQVIMVAAERHPRNYYAWLHMRWITQTLQQHLSLDDTNFLSAVFKWCIKHPSDISGFSFLLFCLFHLPQITISRKQVCSKMCSEILDLTSSFQWKHESVWYFLRTMLASGQISRDEKAKFLGIIETLVSTSDTNNAGVNKFILSAKIWSIEYEQSS